MNLLVAATQVDVSVGGLIVGLLLAALIVLLGRYLAAEVHRLFLPASVIVAILIVFVMGFEVYG